MSSSLSPSSISQIIIEPRPYLEIKFSDSSVFVGNSSCLLFHPVEGHSKSNPLTHQCFLEIKFSVPTEETIPEAPTEESVFVAEEAEEASTAVEREAVPTDEIIPDALAQEICEIVEEQEKAWAAVEPESVPAEEIIPEAPTQDCAEVAENH
jgi:hypothetical protein